MKEIIIISPEKCSGCNACIRNCPSPEANICKRLDNGRYITMVNNDKCIACGQCIESCRYGARDFLDDTEECISAMTKEKIDIIVSPAIKMNIPHRWRGILDWFREQGCNIFDGSLGADICTWTYLRTIDQGTVGNTIASQCPAVVRYIELYQPKLVQSLSPIQSPVGCMAVYMKQYLRRSNRIAVLSPCIAMSYENQETELISFNITIEKLLNHFERNGISIPVDNTDDFEYSFDEIQGQLGSIYSRPGGLRDSLLSNNPDLSIISGNGGSRLYSQIDSYAKIPERKRPMVFDILSCEWGCNMGNAVGQEQILFEVITTMRIVESKAKEHRKFSGMRGHGEDKLLKKFDDELHVVDFLRGFKPSMPTLTPTAIQLKPIFDDMGINPDRCYDCHACGYKSCHEMASAVYHKLNVVDNCIIHAKSVINENYDLFTKQHLNTTEKIAKCLDLSEQLQNNVSQVNDGMGIISDAATATSERIEAVRELLKNIVSFCSNNKTMDESCVTQLISILETVIVSFNVLNENVNVTTDRSEVINRNITDILAIVEEIKADLNLM